MTCLTSKLRARFFFVLNAAELSHRESLSILLDYTLPKPRSALVMLKMREEISEIDGFLVEIINYIDSEMS